MIEQQYVSTTGCVRPTPEVLGLSQLDCELCKGEGVVTYDPARDSWRTCHCVYRASFTECLATYERIKDAQMSSNTSMTQDNCRDHRRDWEDFLADFEGVAKHNLSEKKLAVFKARVVRALTEAQTMRILAIDKETLDHLTYQMEVQLGACITSCSPICRIRRGLTCRGRDDQSFNCFGNSTYWLW